MPRLRGRAGQKTAFGREGDAPMISSVTLSAGAWLRHGDYLVANGVTRVVLTTPPGVIYEGRKFRLPVSEEWFDQIANDRIVPLAKALEHRWPGVVFTLPSERTRVSRFVTLGPRE
jgi:hypothetical protein